MGIFRGDKYIDPKELEDTATEWGNEKGWSSEKARIVAERFMRIWRKLQKRKQAGI